MGGTICTCVVIEHLPLHEAGAWALYTTNRAKTVDLLAHFGRFVDAVGCFFVIVECFPWIKSIII